MSLSLCGIIDIIGSADLISKQVINKLNKILVYILYPLRLVLSWLYFFAFRINKKRVKPKGVPGLKLISVGNITTGGTGKTPFVAYLARLLFSQFQIRPGILMRGYKSPLEYEKNQVFEQEIKYPGIIDITERFREYTLGDRNPGDEALLYHHLRVPAVLGIGKNRYLNAKIFSQLGLEWAILDDGFQHHCLDKDFEFVLIDSANPAGSGLIPLGRGRDSLGSLKQASIIILTRWSQSTAKQKEKALYILNRWAPEIPFFRADHKIGLPYLIFANQKKKDRAPSWQNLSITAFCAIGNPESFKLTLENDLRVKVNNFYKFRDHKEFSISDFEKILSGNKGYILMTEKDAIKLSYPQFSKRLTENSSSILLEFIREYGSRLWTVPIQWNFFEKDEKRFISFLKDIIK